MQIIHNDMLRKIKKNYSEALDRKWAAEREQTILNIFDDILLMEQVGLLNHDDVLAAKNIIFNFGSKVGRAITSGVYQKYIKDVKQSYQYLQSGKINKAIYRRIVQYRLTDLNAILKYYKKGGYDRDNHYCNLVTAVSVLSDYYLHGVIKDSEYNKFIDDCFNVKKCILLEKYSIFSRSPKLHKKFMQKIESGYRVVDAEVTSRKVIIHMVDSNNNRIMLKKKKILGMIFVSK